MKDDPQSQANRTREPVAPGPFSGDIDWWHNACVGWSHDDWELYATGYKSAADILVSHLKASRGDLDTVIYPVAFLFRQYIELRLKQLIRDARALLGRAGGVHLAIGCSHFGQELRPLLKEVWSEQPDGELDELEKRIGEFSAGDPGSTTFRYPEQLDGSRSMSKSTHINIRLLSEAMEPIATFLDGAATGLDEYLGYKAEMEAEGAGDS